MSMYRIAQFLKVNGAVHGVREPDRWLSVPEQSLKVRYQLWHGDSAGGTDLFEARTGNRSRNGLMSRFML